MDPIPQMSRKANPQKSLKSLAELEMENEDYSGQQAIKTLEANASIKKRRVVKPVFQMPANNVTKKSS